MDTIPVEAVASRVADPDVFLFGVRRADAEKVALGPPWYRSALHSTDEVVAFIHLARADIATEETERLALLAEVLGHPVFRRRPQTVVGW